MNIPVFLPSSPVRIGGKLVKGFMSYDRPDIQRNKQGLQLYIKRYLPVLFLQQRTQTLLLLVSPSKKAQLKFLLCHKGRILRAMAFCLVEPE